MVRKLLIVLIGTALLSGQMCTPAPAPPCLETADVTNIPPGNATGSAFGGQYVIVSGYGSSCHTCSRNEIPDFCEHWAPSLTEGTIVTVTQSDGRITFQDASTTATGGVNTDGSFSLGAIIPVTDNESGETIGQGLVLMTGQFVDDRILMTARMRMTGNWPDGLADAEVVNIVTYQRSQP